MNSIAVAKGAVLVGTSKRMKSFPFAFDQHSGPSRRPIQKKGTMAAYWAVRGSGRNKQFALAHRSGLGCVVLMHTTDASLDPGPFRALYIDHTNVKKRLRSATTVVMIQSYRTYKQE